MTFHLCPTCPVPEACERATECRWPVSAHATPPVELGLKPSRERFKPLHLAREELGLRTGTLHVGVPTVDRREAAAAERGVLELLV